jgi:hypothetical protein
MWRSNYIQRILSRTTDITRTYTPICMTNFTSKVASHHLPAQRIRFVSNITLAGRARRNVVISNATRVCIPSRISSQKFSTLHYTTVTHQQKPQLLPIVLPSSIMSSFSHSHRRFLSQEPKQTKRTMGPGRGNTRIYRDAREAGGLRGILAKYVLVTEVGGMLVLLYLAYVVLSDVIEWDEMKQNMGDFSVSEISSKVAKGMSNTAKTIAAGGNASDSNSELQQEHAVKTSDHNSDEQHTESTD